MAEPTADDLWTIVQRLLVFEEPALKWLHLKRWLKRTGRRLALDERENCSETANLRHLFSRILGCQSFACKTPAHCRAFSLAFATEQMKRFENAAFKRWQEHGFALGMDGQSKNTDSSNKEWLELAGNLYPHWSLLATSGPWSNDPRAALIGEFVECVDELSESRDVGNSFEELVAKRRANLPGHFLPEKVVLVEGATESILLPLLAKACDLDLNALGLMLIPAGGANQVARKYAQLKEIVSIPIFCLLDRDAQVQRQLISAGLRSQDWLYVLEDGEIEDLFNLDSFILLLNGYLNTLPWLTSYCQPIRHEDFGTAASRTAVLEKLWRERDLGKFDKVGFAKFLSQSTHGQEEISDDGRLLIRSLASHKSNPRDN